MVIFCESDNFIGGMINNITNIHTNWLILFLISSSLMFFATNSGDNDNWELRKERNGIKVFTRAVEGSKYVEFKAEGVFNVPKQNFIDVLKNVGEYEEWVPDLKFSKLLEVNKNHQIHYIITKLPFPLKDRDEIYKYTFHQKNNNIVEVKMLALPDYLPIEKDIIRMPKSYGSYIFESIGPSQTKVSLQMHNDPGGNLPAWAVNSKIVKVPFGTLLALEKQASGK